jgi:hypothetical protein
MKTADMRQALRDKGIPVRRSNEDVQADYNEMKKKETEEQQGIEKLTEGQVKLLSEAKKELDAEIPPIRLASTNEWTYIGAGDEPPHMINFMGMQKFVRGQATSVSNPLVIEKIKSHRCFVKGSVDPEVLFTNDEKAKKEVELKREEDVKIQIMAERANR